RTQQPHRPPHHLLRQVEHPAILFHHTGMRRLITTPSRRQHTPELHKPGRVITVWHVQIHPREHLPILTAPEVALHHPPRHRPIVALFHDHVILQLPNQRRLLPRPVNLHRTDIHTALGWPVLPGL